MAKSKSDVVRVGGGSAQFAKKSGKNVKAQTRKEAIMADATTEAPKTEKAPKKTRPVFPLKNAVSSDGPIALSEDGKLTSVPVNWTSDYQNLKPGQFVHRAIYWEWRAHKISVRIKDLEGTRTEYMENAEEARKGPDPTKRKLKKLAKMRDQIAALEAQLQSEGIDTEA